MKLLVITQTVDIHDENLGSFHRWLEEFSKFYEEVVVITSFKGSFSLPDGVSVYSLGKESGTSKGRRILRFFELFSHHHPHVDVVFFHMIPEFVLAASPFLISLKKPTALWYVHKSVTGRLRWAERFVEYVFTASELSFRLPSKKVIYTGHAIDTDFFSPAGRSFSSPVVKFLSVGRISQVKNYETLIHALAFLKQNWNKQWTCSIIGGPIMPRDHEYLGSLKKLVAEKGLEQHIVFQGPRPFREIPMLYRDHDVFVSMSTTGSLDKAVLEAMSAGMTVVVGNEAFKNIIPAPYFVEARSAEFLAERIKRVADENRPNMALREIVMKGHSLGETIKKIVTTLGFHSSP